MAEDELNPEDMTPPEDIFEFDEPGPDLTDTFSAPLPWEEGGVDFTGVEETQPRYEAAPEDLARARHPQAVPERPPVSPSPANSPLGFEPEEGGEPTPKIPDAPPPVPPPPDDLPGLEDNVVGFQTMPESFAQQIPPPRRRRRQQWGSRQEKAQATRSARRQRLGMEPIDYGEDAEGPEMPQDGGFFGGGMQAQQGQQGAGGGTESVTGVLQEILAAIEEGNEKLNDIADKLDDVGTYGE